MILVQKFSSLKKLLQLYLLKVSKDECSLQQLYGILRESKYLDNSPFSAGSPWIKIIAASNLITLLFI